ncbi:hypothetical protein [Desulfonatronum parangueonense]
MTWIIGFTPDELSSYLNFNFEIDYSNNYQQATIMEKVIRSIRAWRNEMGGTFPRLVTAQ